jgi:hypothetical protein
LASDSGGWLRAFGKGGGPIIAYREIREARTAGERLAEQRG